MNGRTLAKCLAMRAEMNETFYSLVGEILGIDAVTVLQFSMAVEELLELEKLKMLS